MGIEPIDMPAGACILLAEDEQALQDVTREFLEQLGYRVVTANNGLEAVRQYQQHRHAIVLAIFDVMMPCLNGPEAAELICADISALPFIFVTGYDSKQELDRVKIPQGFKVLHKPVAFDFFQKVIEEMIGSADFLAGNQ